jgi:hypothetical protein
MKYLTIIAIIGGILGMLLAVITVVSDFRFLGLSGAGYLRGTSSLLLLALSLLVYKKVYHSK